MRTSWMGDLRRWLLLTLCALCLQAQGATSCKEGIERAQSRNFEVAQDLLWMCLGSGRPNHSATYVLALTYRDLHNYAAGLKKTQEVLELSTANEDFLYLGAYLHYLSKHPRYSMVLLSKAYSLEPDDWRLHQLFALNYISFRMPDAVELELKKAIALNPDNAELHYQLGRFYFSAEQYETSIEEANRSIQLAPDFAEAYDSLGLSYEAMQDTERAAQNYQKSIDLDRASSAQHEWPLIDYGSMILRNGSPAKSLSYLLAALLINPSSPQGNYQAARAMRLLKRDAEAERYLRRTIEADPSYSYAYYQLASIVRQRGGEMEAAGLMEKYKSLIDNDKTANTYNPGISEHMAR